MSAVLDQLAAVKAAYPFPLIAGRYFTLERQGRLQVALCPFHPERTPSFYAYPDHGHCFGCGWTGDHVDLVRKFHRCALGDALRIIAGEKRCEAVVSPVAPTERDDTAANVERAMRLWREALLASSSLVEVYLKERLQLDAIDIPESCIRFHPACPRGRDERLPAMLALMVDEQGEPTGGIHRTFLRPDGRGKVEHGKTKMMLGPTGTIRVAEHWGEAIGVTEGIENALAVQLRLEWGPCWAAGSRGALAAFPVMPSGVLHIFADCDDSGTGLRDAETCAGRWAEAGREVYLHRPPDGRDWLDASLDDMAAIDEGASR